MAEPDRPPGRRTSASPGFSGTELALVIGGTGFLGRAVVARAEAAGVECLGVGRDAGIPELLAERRPGLIFHLAGSARPDEDLFAANVTPMRGVLQAVQALAGYTPGVIVLGSAAEYGDLGPEPIPETARELPLNEYGVAKLAQTRLALVARQAGARLTVARLFNVMGPGMDATLAPVGFATRARAALASGQREITVGNLGSVRDYLDVEDAARALWAIGTSGLRHDIVNVCSGQPVRMGQILDEILRQLGAQGLDVRIDPGRATRAADVPVSVGDPARLEECTGERYSFDLGRSVSRLLTSSEEHA